MASNKKKRNAQPQIKSLKTEIVATRVAAFWYMEPPETSLIRAAQFELNFRYFIPETLDRIEIATQLSFGCFIDEKANAPTPVSELTTICTFVVVGLADLKLQDGMIALPAKIIRQLTLAAHGTARGLLVSKLAQTPFENAMIPLMDEQALKPHPEIHKDFFVFHIGPNPNIPPDSPNKSN